MELPSHKVCQIQPNSSAVYVRHRPETTLLYQIVQEYWPEFQAELASHGKYLPAHVIKEFDEYLKCGRLEHGFLRVKCESCHDEKLVAFSCKKRGYAKYKKIEARNVVIFRDLGNDRPGNALRILFSL